MVLLPGVSSDVLGLALPMWMVDAAAGYWPLVATGAIASVLVLRWQRRRRSVAGPDGPILVFSLNGSARDAPAVAARTRREPMPGATEAPTPVSPLRTPPVAVPNGRAAVGDGPERNATAAPNVRLQPAPVFERPESAALTLQILPGMLEVIEGFDRGLEIPFLRMGAAGVPEFTLGRAPGVDGRHVQVRGGTVSRFHARVRFVNGNWEMCNLSATNPARVNGHELGGVDSPHILDGGDQISLGEVTLRFHGARKKRAPVRSVYASLQGRSATNEDAVLSLALGGDRDLLAVAHGLGQRAGEVASRIALELLGQKLQAGMELVPAVRAVNGGILTAARENPAWEGMGTTIVAVLRSGSSYHIARVGDSRAYRIEPDAIQQLTHDARAAGDGRRADMTREEGVRSPWRNVVMRSLGVQEEVEVDLFGPYDAESQPHIVLLCTDGLFGVVSDDGILQQVRSRALEAAPAELSALALANGSDDNITVAMMEFGTMRRGAGPPPAVVNRVVAP